MNIFTVYAPTGQVLFAAGCLQCDDRPLCAVPYCRRPEQLGDPRGAHTCMPTYHRGLIWHFSTEAELAAWTACHPPGHAGSWSLRALAPPTAP